MKLTLPLPPNRANAREHWRVTHRKKNAYYDLAHLMLCGSLSCAYDGGLVAKYDGLPLIRPTLTATFYLWAKMDRDNLMARLKWPIDCLVRYGLLVDDNEKWLDLQMPKQVIDRKNQRVEITLEPAAERED